jgi:hypothetical protein
MINTISLDGKKLFAVIDKENYVIDCWAAETLEEAQNDNPDKRIVAVTLKNSPFKLYTKYFPKE